MDPGADSDIDEMSIQEYMLWMGNDKRDWDNTRISKYKIRQSTPNTYYWGLQILQYKKFRTELIPGMAVNLGNVHIKISCSYILISLKDNVKSNKEWRKLVHEYVETFCMKHGIPVALGSKRVSPKCIKVYIGKPNAYNYKRMNVPVAAFAFMCAWVKKDCIVSCLPRDIALMIANMVLPRYWKYWRKK